MALAGLVLVLLVGVILRALLMAAWRPAFVGYSDSGAYLYMAMQDLWGATLHPVGYALLLSDLHAITRALWLMIGLQHLFGLLSAILLWLTVRQAGASRWLALLPAAIVALNGAEIFLEHSILSESLFILLLSCSLYCAARATGSVNPRWAALAGLLLALDNTVRVVAQPLIIVLLAWLLLGSGGSWRLRARATGYAMACVLVVLGGYAVIQHQQTGYWGLSTPAGGWNLYGRVAPFADCTKFTPPAGTRVLCEKTPPAKRTQTVEEYLYSPPVSPGLKAFSRFGGPESATQASDRRIESFARTAIEHQPLDYARTILEGMLAYVTPVRIEFANREELGASYDLFYHHTLFDAGNSEYVLKNRLPWYGVHAYHHDQALLSFLLGYETHTRVTGWLMALLMLLTLLAPFSPRGRPRQIGTLLFLVAWASLLSPVATHWWDSRYTIPSLGPLGAAAAIGLWQAARFTRRITRPRRTATRLTSPVT